MVNDCLVTKLKGVVNNDSLDFFGMIKFHVKNNTGGDVNLHFENTGTFKVVDGSAKLRATGSSEAYSSTFNTTGDNWIGFAEGEYDVIMPKYAITAIIHGNAYEKGSAFSFNVEDFNYSENLIQAAFGNTSSYGNIDTLVGKCPLTNLSIMRSDIIGTMKELGKFEFDRIDIAFTKLTGRLEDFVASRRYVKGVDSYSTTVHYHDCPGVTFNNHSIATVQGAAFSWEPNASDNTKTDITLGEETITIDSVTVNA